MHHFNESEKGIHRSNDLLIVANVNLRQDYNTSFYEREAGHSFVSLLIKRRNNRVYYRGGMKLARERLCKVKCFRGEDYI